MEDKLIQWLVSSKAKWRFLLLVLFASILAARGLGNLQVSFELEELFPNDDADIAFYTDYVKEFGYDNDYVAVFLLAEKSIYDSLFRYHAQAFSKKAKQIHGIEQVLSPLDLKKTIKSSFGLVSSPLFSTTDRISLDSLFISKDPWLNRVFQSPNYLMIFLEHNHFTELQQGKSLLGELESALLPFPFQYHLTGKLPAQLEFQNLIRSDFLVFIISSIGLSLVLLLILFRNAGKAMFPLLVGSLSLMWVLGLMGWSGTSINLMSSLLPPIVLFVAYSDCVHLLTAREQSDSQTQAIKKVLVPTFLTSLTTAVGFLSLIILPVKPIQTLGLYSALAVLFAFTLTYLLFPFFISKNRNGSLKGSSVFHWVVNLISTNLNIILFSFLILALVAGFSSFYLKVDAYLLNDLPDNASSKQSFAFADRQAKGSKPWEIYLTPKNGADIWHPDFLAETDKIGRYLEQEFGLAQANSHVDYLKYSQYLLQGEYAISALGPKSVALARNLLSKSGLKLVQDDGKGVRIIGFIPEWGSQQTEKKMKNFESFFKASVDDKVVAYQFTGTNYLIDKSHTLLADYLFKSLVAAIAVVSVLFGAYFKSLRICLLALVPNLLPLLLIGACMVWFGISLQLSSIIVFAIAFGVVVDDTIHFLSTYYRQPPGDPKANILTTMKSAGLGMWHTTWVLVTGFSVLLFSSFGATFYLGLFLCLSLLMALIIDFVLLPALLIKFDNRSPS